MSFRTALVLVLALIGAEATTRAFSLTDFPDLSEIDAGLVRRWGEFVDNPGQPLQLTYAIDPAFLANEDPETVANATAAIQAALQSWSDATNGLITFVPAEWGPVRNEGQPQNAFQGPAFDVWLQCAEDCGFVGDCIAENCPTPGWGAHIDFFSETTGYMVSTGGVDYEMESCNLGFTAVHRIGSTKIVSADIYLNHDWNWTTDQAQANPARSAPDNALQEQVLSCGCAHRIESGVSRPDLAGRANCSTQQQNLVIDLETVLVHEIGHALGLEHPNEAAANNSPNLSPWTYDPGWPVSQSIVMYGGYNGVNRQLTNDDIGGISYLYPPALYGDINADGRIGFLDAFHALDIFEGRVAPDPWSVNRLDYNARNGRIDMDELQQLLLWVVDPANHPPGQVPSQNAALWESTVTGPTSITITGYTDPADIGVGGVAQLILQIDNPDQRVVQGWDVRIDFNSDVLLNPRYAQGRTFLTESSLIPMTVTELSPGLSELRIGSLGFDTDSSTAGLLAIVEFDIDLAAAASVSQVDFVFNEADSEIVVAQPYSHAFSKDPNFPDESLTYIPIVSDAYLLDVDTNGVVDLNDLYAQNQSPVDVNYDSMITDYDMTILRAILREDELDDVAGKFLGPPPLPSLAHDELLPLSPARRRPLD